MSRRPPYIQRRGFRLSFRIGVPQDLQPLLGLREVTKALPTTDKTHAEPLALEFAARAKRLFCELRANMATGLDGEDERPMAVDLDKVRELVRSTRHKLELDTLQDQHADQLLDQRRDHLREMEKVKLQVQVETLSKALSSLGSPGIATVVGPPASAKAGNHRLRETIAIWQRLKAPKRATVEIYTAVVQCFESRFPAICVEQITKTDVRDFVKWRHEQGKSAKTIEKEHGALRALLGIAESEEWIPSNPASKTALPKIKRSVKRSFTPEECKLIFESPVFVSGVRPSGCMGDAAFWMPLLLLHTGARREEIALLTTDRVRAHEGVPYLLLDTMDEDETLKSEQSKRCVPVHDTLVKIGFLDFVALAAMHGGGQLFPLLKRNTRGQYAGKWGDWWGRYIRRTVGLTDTKIQPAHGFRHLFITECRRLKFRSDYEYALVGHAEGKPRTVHDAYGEFLVAELAEEINRIDFRGLDLSHLFKG